MHHTGDFRLLLLLRVGAAGAPRVVWFSRRSQRLIVEVPVPAERASPEAALRDGVVRGVSVAQRWRAKHRPHADASPLAAAATAVSTPAEEL